MLNTTFHIEKMDCAAEEQLVRMKLSEHPEVKRLSFDIAQRTLVVTHDGATEEIARSIDTLDLDARQVKQQEVDTFLEDGEEASQRRLLIIVLLINFSLFVLEVATGIIAQSMGLVADSLDMLADAIVYGLSLYAVGKALSSKKRVAAISGYFQLGLALFGVVETLRRVFGDAGEPTFSLMIGISLIALIGNVVSLVLLQRSQNQEAHMQASKIFTSNDVIVNIGVIIAGVLVYLTGSKLPDLIAGAAIFLLVGYGSLRILRLAK